MNIECIYFYKLLISKKKYLNIKNNFFQFKVLYKIIINFLI